MTFKKSRPLLGQHFLTDPQVIEQIIELINPKPQDTMIEIGPGRGALTERLVNATASLHAIEIDRRLAERLEARLLSDTLHIHRRDALEFDYRAVRNSDEKFRVVGNLPYSISTPLIMKLLECSESVQDMCFMVQREVADRLTAHCGSRKYGRLTVSVARTMNVESVFDVDPDAFSPPPEVQSTFIYLKPKPSYPTNSVVDRMFSELVRQAFGNRRKTLKNSLSRLVNEETFLDSGINSGERAENLSVEQYMQLAEIVAARNSGNAEAR